MVTEAKSEMHILPGSPGYNIVEFKDISDQNIEPDTEEGMGRIYCKMSPDVLCFQLRATQSIKGKSKPRQMIASITVTVAELREIANFFDKNK